MGERRETPEQRYERLKRRALQEQGDAPDLFVHQTELRAGLLEEREIIFHAVVDQLNESFREAEGELQRKFDALSSEVTQIRAELDLLRAAAAKPATPEGEASW